MSSTRVLVVEDDRNILRGVLDTLEGEGYEAIGASNGAEALRLYASQPFDLILLDIMMPEKSGYEVCREVRRKDAQTPIIMLTAKGQEIDKVLGLELGADDYVTKPFGIHELLARIGSVLRRSRRNDPQQVQAGANLPDVIPFGEAQIDRKKYSGRLGKKSFDLTAREIKLVEVFFEHPGEVLSRDVLLNSAWGINYMGTTRTLDQHIAQLRKKVEKDVRDPKVIETVHSVGYRYQPDRSRSRGGSL